MRLISRFLSLVLMASLLIATERHAWAYVDPGSGLFVLQSFASVTAAVSYFFRRRIRAFFGRSKATPQAALPENELRKAA